MLRSGRVRNSDLLLVVHPDLCVVQMSVVQLLLEFVEWMLQLVRKVVTVVLAGTPVATLHVLRHGNCFYGIFYALGGVMVR
jgi:hypothetical protein